MKNLWKYIRPYRVYIALGLLIKFVGAMTELMLPKIMGHIIDVVAPRADEKEVWLWGGAMVLCALLALASNISANWMSATSSGHITRRIRHDLFEKVSYLSAEQIDEFGPSSLISRLTSDTYNVNSMIIRMQRLGVRAPILLIGGILITLTLDPVLTLVLVATLPFIGIIVYFITRISIPLYEKQQVTLDGMVRTVQENFTGVRVIKALSKTKDEQRRFEDVNATLVEREQRAGIVMAITNPVNTLILNLGLCAVILVGAYRVQIGSGSAGDIIAFLSYFSIILNAMIGITRIFILCSKGLASANRISVVLECGEALPLLPATEKVGDAAVSFENVTFSYGKRESNLQEVSFSVQPGQTLGILGPTGAGKSTVIKLLLRLYDPDAGVIRLHGQDIRSIPPAELRTHFGMVFQNDFVVAGSILENIDFYRSLTREQCEEAASIAQAAEYITDMPEGYEYAVTTQGSNLSGGQRQRLLIARAIAAKPDVLILDDASSALDYRTDMLLRRAIHEHCSQTTTVIIAQRISSVKNADCILVMEDGRIQAAGTHDTLLQTCASYRQISELQMGGQENA